MKKSMLIKDYEKEEKSKQKRHNGKSVLKKKGEIEIGMCLFIVAVFLFVVMMIVAVIIDIKRPDAQKLTKEIYLPINNIDEEASFQSIFFKREWGEDFDSDNVPKGNLKITIENKTGEDFSPKIKLVEKNGKKVSIVYEFDGKYYSAIETRDTVVKKDDKEDLIIYGGIQELQKAVQDKIDFLKRDGVSKLEIGWFMPNESEKGVGYKKFDNYYKDETYPVIFEVKVSDEKQQNDWGNIL
ncbi:MAG: hypothetical protein Q4G05_03115 [Clostridia bacterium]|nr:hypothetical protein [Clostridia bacterium]